jgi:hypothetical protein
MRAIEHDMTHGRPQTIFRQVEILKRTANEDARRMNRLMKRALAVNQKNARTLSPQQPGALKAAESCPYDTNVKLLHAYSSLLL